MAVYVIGDIHGHIDPLRRLMDRVRPTAEDVVMQLGDCINRGPNSFEVVEYWINFSLCPYYVLGGNHEELMYDYLSEASPSIYGYGGKETIASYRKRGWRCQKGDPSSIPPEHYLFYLQGYPWTRTVLVTTHYLFTHSGFDFGKDAAEQNPYTVRWGRVHGWQRGLPTVVRGHTPHRNVHIEPGIIHVDTGCGLGGKLSCIRLPEETVISEWPDAR